MAVEPIVVSGGEVSVMDDAAFESSYGVDGPVKALGDALHVKAGGLPSIAEPADRRLWVLEGLVDLACAAPESSG